jgi:hypothetical protein
MDADRRRRVEDLCDAALNRDPGDRSAFIAAACAGDSALRRDVEALLAHAPAAERFLSASIGEVAANVLDDGGPSLVGRQLGAYQIVSLLGSGGMGEVYRGRDSRLERDVAVKVLLARLAADPDRVRRFAGEARAASQLNHPNILSIYDVGTHDGSPYLVSELLEGDTLRERLARDRFPVQKAIDFAIQMAHALAAAHDKGIVHRDLKPENVFITRDGRVKILDFGLAKLSDPAATVLGHTEPGTVMGTVGYMSPEQLRGEAVDHRTDIFALGAILYEMISGTRAFGGASSVETMSAVMRDDPPDLSAGDPSVPAAVERIVRHCLEKQRDTRWQTARDLALALEAVSAVKTSHAPVVPTEASRVGSGRGRVWITIGTIAVLAAATAFVATSASREPVPLSFHRLTFGRGTIWSARFAPEGGTITYSASWDGNPVELFSTRPDAPESRSLDIRQADVLSVSASGEMALLLKPGNVLEWEWKGGTLARASLAGGAPHENLEGVQAADWAPDAASLAAVRIVGTRSRLEFPIGTVLYDTPDRIGALRVSRTGSLIAFADRPAGLSGTWTIAVIDRSGKKSVVSSGWAGDFIDLAWSPPGDEIWFDTRQGGDDALHAVTLDGKQRVLARLGTPVRLFDVAADGRTLIGRMYWRSGVSGLPPGEANERDLSWLDATELDDISYDGRTLLVTEFGEGGGVGRSSVYLRRIDRTPAIRLGDGQAFTLSPDGRRALTLRRGSPPELVLWPTGAGEPSVVKNANISDYTWADWLPDGKQIVFAATETGHSSRCYVQALDGSLPRPLTPEGTTLLIGQKVVSPDGQHIAVIGSDGRVLLYPLAGGELTMIPGIQPGDVPIGWSADERALYVFRKIESAPKVYLVDLATGRNEPWREITPADRVGIVNVWGVRVAPDDRSYYYSYMRNLSDLYLLDGLR